MHVRQYPKHLVSRTLARVDVYQATVQSYLHLLTHPYQSYRLLDEDAALPQLHTLTCA